MTRWATHLTMSVHDHHRHYQYNQDCTLGRIEICFTFSFLKNIEVTIGGPVAFAS